MNEQVVSDPAAGSTAKNETVAAVPGEPRIRDQAAGARTGPHVLAIGRAERTVAFVHQALMSLQPQIEVTPDEKTACAYLTQGRYDLIVLILPLEGSDGAAICRRLRQADRRVPLLVLDAEGTMDGEVAGLTAGADTYLFTPLSAEELRARCAALLRRVGAWPSPRRQDESAATLASDSARRSAPLPKDSGGAAGGRRSWSGRALSMAGTVLATILHGQRGDDSRAMVRPHTPGRPSH